MSSVFVVESPSPRDLSDGRTEGRALCETMGLLGVATSYTLAVNRTEFVRPFQDNAGTCAFKDFVDTSGHLAIVHLSMHGNKDGIGLTDGDFITWAQLSEIFTPLNLAFGGLFLSLSTCEGAHAEAVASAMTSDRAHFYAMVGSTKAIAWSDAVVAYTVFYHNWAKKVNLAECVRLMNEASGHDGFIPIVGGAKLNMVAAERSAALAQA